MTPPATLDLVAWLRRPGVYPDATQSVTVVETHMSWVFLTDTRAYKLKKAIRHDGLDFSTADRRHLCCDAELRLNRRLAPSVYLAVLPVTREADGSLAIAGRGEPVDWLVQMLRLPAADMLDAVIGSGGALAAQAPIRAAARRLARFYVEAARPPLSGRAHREWLGRGTTRDRDQLSQPRYGLSRARVDALVEAQLAFLDRHAALFDRRVADGRIVDGHGDLRPEHVYLGAEPAIIDCLEFSAALRVVDPLDEVAFLGLECERLGDVRPGHWWLDEYAAVTGDEPPEPLLEFYRVYRALRRATLAAWHLDDPSVREPGRFAARARWYLETVTPVTARAAP